MKPAVRYSVSAQWAVVRYGKNVQMYMLHVFPYMLAVQTFLQSESIQQPFFSF